MLTARKSQVIDYLFSIYNRNLIRRNFASLNLHFESSVSVTAHKLSLLTTRHGGTGLSLTNWVDTSVGTAIF